MEKNKNILVVEDDPRIREVIKGKLSREGFTTLEAGDGQEGLKLALEKRPDLILLDIVMPKMDGMTMLKKLREENEWGKRVPVILLTNQSPDDKIMRGITRDEPAYFLTKSDEIGDVVHKVKKRLGLS